MKLFCFPYAGGTSAIFSGWSRALPKEIKVIPVDYPGHGMRFNEPLHDTVSGLVELFYNEISPQIGEGPYCFYGHSLGSLISFELARRLKESSHPLPTHLIVSGSGGPQYPGKNDISELPDEEFLLEVQGKYKGFVDELRENEEVLQLFLPLLRADFYLSEHYEYKEQESLSCSINVIRCMGDQLLDPEELVGWQIHSTQKVRFYSILGDHFSLFRDHKHKNLLLECITHLCKLK